MLELGLNKDGLSSNLRLTLQEQGIRDEKLEELAPTINAIVDVMLRNNRKVAEDIERVYGNPRRGIAGATIS